MPEKKKKMVAAGGLNDKAVPTGGGHVKDKLPAENKILSNANAAVKGDKATGKKPKRLVGNDGAS